MTKKTVLWWGRSDINYSRNRIVRQLFIELGWKVLDFKPKMSALADIEAIFSNSLSEIDLVWVPCFRQRDLAAAKRWSKRRKIPLVFDPLISAYDKQVYERNKFSKTSKKGKRLLKWEQSLFQKADYLIADTEQHALFFNQVLGADIDKLSVIPVGAEEELFSPHKKKSPGGAFQVLFYGSYIGLQGPEVIAKAIKLYQGPAVDWNFVGSGPLRAEVELSLSDMDNVHFTDWVPYEALPDKISQADLCLGVFGATEKTRRVIANKVYQALACGRPVLSCESEAYPAELRESLHSGMFFVPANDPHALAVKLAELASNPLSLVEKGQEASKSYQKYFSNKIVKEKLEFVLRQIGLH